MSKWLEKEEGYERVQDIPRSTSTRSYGTLPVRRLEEETHKKQEKQNRRNDKFYDEK